MRYLELCTLTESQIDDLLGLMKELNAELTVTPQMQRRAVAAPGTRIFAAENEAKQEANALYQALGFEQRDTNVYKMSL